MMSEVTLLEEFLKRGAQADPDVIAEEEAIDIADAGAGAIEKEANPKASNPSEKKKGGKLKYIVGGAVIVTTLAGLGLAGWWWFNRKKKREVESKTS